MDTREQYSRFLLPVVAQGVEPLVIVSAKGRTVTADDGRSYLDCFSGISVVNAGHGHPRILAAARAQMEQLVHCCSYVYHVPVVGELAARLAALTPGGLTKSFFSNSGAEANEGAMRLAKQATGRHEMVALTYGFHGRTIGTLSITGNSARKKNNGPYLPGVDIRPRPVLLSMPAGADLSVVRSGLCPLLERRDSPANVRRRGGFRGGARAGRRGHLTPPPEYFAIAARIFHDDGTLFIVDEVQTGFGRTGKMFGIDHSPGVVPDIVTMAKGIASGFPAGRVHRPRAGFRGDEARRPPVHVRRQSDLLRRRPGQPRRHRGRETGRERRSARRVAAVALPPAAGDVPLIGDVRGRGLMIGLELVRDRKTKEPATQEAKAVRAAMRERGILVGVGGDLRQRGAHPTAVVDHRRGVRAHGGDAGGSVAAEIGRGEPAASAAG